MSNVFVIIKMCYVHNQWYDISCATLHVRVHDIFFKRSECHEICLLNPAPHGEDIDRFYDCVFFHSD